VAVLALLLLSCTKHPVVEEPMELEDLSVGVVEAGFEARQLYLGDADQVLGARLVHVHTGFVLDLMQQETAPQGLVWVNTPPVSDRGEPHTQEHLLLGKGNKGRSVSTRGSMALVRSSAFTAQLTTAYHLHTTAGTDTFLTVLHDRLDALLNPDYADLEIEREVHHFGVSADAEGQLHLEEKGTVYNEMDSSYNRPWGRFWRTLNQVAYGVDHPMSRVSGGLPSAIRDMTAEHIRDFHAETHHLGNMGMIGVLPPDLGLEEVLERVDASLTRLQPEPTDRTFIGEADLPPAEPWRIGEPTPVPYPAADASQATDVVLVWPAGRDLDLASRTLLDLFLETLAGAENSNLYRRLVDTDTRQVDLGATEVYAWVRDLAGDPLFLGVGGISGARVDASLAAELRDQVLDELRAVTSWEADSPELEDFNRRLGSALTARERQLRKWVATPPRFGFRGTGLTWHGHLRHLQTQPGDALSLTLKPQLAAARRELARQGNVWTEWIASWELLDAEPEVLWHRGDPELLARLESEREGRAQAELDRLGERYGLEDDQETLRAFSADYDAATAELEAAAIEEVPPFLDAPPLTWDDPLDFEVRDLGGVPLVRSHFASMSGASVGVALDLRGTAPQQRQLVGLLPRLLTDVGLVVDGVVMSYDTVLERQQQEILHLSAWLDVDGATGRVELALEAAGTSARETDLALGWLEHTLRSPDWRPENLSRIRDVVVDEVERLALVRTRSEESWVQDPPSAWRHQSDRLMLSADSFLTQAHDAWRVRWRLTEAGPDLEALVGWLAELESAASELGREDFTSRLGQAPGGLSEAGARVAADAGEDLSRLLTALPEASWRVDMAGLCQQVSADLAEPPAVVLADLEALRAGLAVRGGARMWAVGSVGGLDGLELGGLLGVLGDGEVAGDQLRGEPWVRARLAARGADPEALHVGLVHPSGRGGVHLHSAPGADVTSRDEGVLLDYLTGQRFAGHGAHTLFMKTWAAGLAYSNGARPTDRQGLLRYYAERCPELHRTLAFVIEELQRAEADEGQTRYALAQSFNSRAAATYESRGRDIAQDLADGRTPEVVAGFRTALLELARSEGIAERVQERHEAVYGRVLPGYGPDSASVDGAVYFVIGPEDQLAGWEAWLASVEGEGTKLVRLYDRDFWID